MLTLCPSCGLQFHHSGGRATETCPHCRPGSHTLPLQAKPGWTSSVWWLLLTRPEQAFQQTALTDLPLSTTLVWAITLSFIGHGVALLWSSLFVDLGEIYDQLLQVTATPFLIVIETFLASLWLTLGLWMTGGFEKTHLPRTMKIVALSDVANFWAVLPIVGPLIALIFKIRILANGCTQAYGTSRWQLVFILLLPLILFGVFMIGLILFFGGLAAVLTLALQSLQNFGPFGP